MQLRYREEKTTQAAARLLRLHDGRMNHMKLIKLLYIADRQALLSCGRPITFDWYFSLPHGPVLSFTLNRINEDPDPVNPSYWHRYISERVEHQVSLVSDDVPNDQLSPAEESILDHVFEEFGRQSPWQLRDYSHTLPEWQDPEGSRLPIELRDIMLGEGLSEDDVREVIDALKAEEAAAEFLG